MADYQLDSTGNNISYPNTEAFLNGATPATSGGDGTYYPKVDMSLWDQATMCGTCHVGGVFYERDRQGVRLPQRAWNDMFAGKINPITSTVWENYTPGGADASFVTSSPWLMPAYQGNDPTKPAITMPFGWVPAPMPMANKNGVDPTNPMAADAYQLVAKQLMVPNVKEMDCLFCHYTGYDNIPASAMTQAGSLNAAPAAGAGLFDMTPGSTSYMGYNPYNGKVAFTTVKTTPLFAQMTSAAKQMNWPAFKGYSTHELVTLTPVVTNNIVARPSDNNCMQCHATKTLKNLPEMFGVTGTSSGFLSSAPMIYDPANPYGPLGKRMVAYDVKTLFAMFGMGGDPALTAAMLMAPDGSGAQYMMGSLPWPNAMGMTPFNFASWNDPGFVGGNNISGAGTYGMAAAGPLYYYNVNPTTGAPVVDQNILKRSTMPFPRAEWFKRGDAWQDGQDVHTHMGCGACHYTGNSTNKNQCDPGRGFDTASGIQDSVPPLQNRGVLNDYGDHGERTAASGLDEILAATKKHDTRNTVKRCEFCHIPAADGQYKDYYGNVINNYGAPNPVVKHRLLGLSGPNADGSGPGPDNAKVQMVDHFNTHGNYGGKGIPRETRFDTDDTDPSFPNLAGTGSGGTPGGTILNPNGNHLDVIDCTVCHVQKVAMAVRSLEALSGMRFPAVIGTDPSKGMFGLFEDPTDGLNPGFGGKLNKWKPLVMWQAQGNKILPLNFSDTSDRLSFRRKLHLTNSITAILWNNEGSNIDANGDGAKGGILDGTKDSLVGVKDIFSGDAPDENNTQGYGLPIFDPWIQKDLKAGFTFGPSPLSVISVGFGTTGPYASIYDTNGDFNSTSTQYASIWSGAFVFTEPEQITAYKEHRGTNWNDTTVTMVGAPFMVTHGVKPTNQYVLGKSCKDCHAPGKEFFKGSFDMIGSAVPANTNYNPTKYIMPDAYGNIQIDPATGDPVRAAGMPGVTFADVMGPYAAYANSMLMRPIEPIRIKANKGDLRGYLEATNKLGQPREVNLVHDTTNINPATGKPWSYASTVDRYEAMYPPTDGHDIAIYYKITDVRADGTPKAISKGDSYDAIPMTGALYASYLETLGAAPAAQINTIGGSDVTGNPATVTIGTGTAIHFVATDAGNSNLTYTWTFSDLPLKDPVTGASNVKTGKDVTRSITSAKSFYANLQVKNNNTGVTATDKQYVKVTSAPVLTSVIGSITTTAGVTTVPVTVTAAHTRIYVKWGDNTEQSYMDNTSNTLNLTHKYFGAAQGQTFTGSVKVLNGGSVVGTQVLSVTPNP